MKNNSNKRSSITTSFWHKLLVNLLVLCFLVQPNLAIIVSEKSSGNLPSRSEKSSPKQEVNQSESRNSSLDAAAEIAEASKHSFSLKSFLSLFEATSENTEPNLAPLPLPTPTPEPFAIVRKGFILNGKVDGSIQQLNGENTTFNSTGNMTGDLKVPGVPSVVVNGTPIWSGVVTGTGTATPTAYQIILNSGARLRNLLNRTNPVTMPSVPTPTASTGTVSLVISNPSQVPASFANIRDVTLNTGAGIVAVPPGNYRNFIVNSGSKLKFGTVGSSQPVVYNIAQLTLNSTSALEIVGPVIINSSSNITINGSTGVLANEGMLRLRMSAGNFTLNSSSNFYGSVTAPNGTITINSNSNLYGNIACNILTINSGGLLKISPLDVLPAVSLAINTPANNSSTTATSITVSGTASSQSGIANVLVNNQPATYNAATQTWTISNVPLVIGSNTITVKATDNTEAQTTSTITVTRTQPPPPDTTAPTLTIASPANGSTTQATSTSVSGTVADLGTNASGVASVTVNGSNAALSGGNWNFANVGLNIGSNTITVRATDVAGNFTTQTVTLVRQPANVPDTTPPTISVTAPLNNSTTQADKTTVNGTVTDTGGTTPSGVANVKVNGVNAVLTSGNWSLTNVALTIGSNTITITSTDNAGNTSTQSIIVNRENVPDTTPPTLVITSPANNSTTQAETTTVSGTVSDTGGTTPSGVASVKVNGVNAAIIGGTWSFANFTLSIGTTTINVQATDVAGNVSNAQVTITREPVPDTTPPTITIASPANNSTTQAETISVSGTVTDTGGTTPSGVASIAVNDVPATFDSATGNWNFASVALNIGTNTITVIATDTAGNIATSVVTVTREAIPDTTPPTLVVTSPTNNSTTQTETITVSGTVTDSGGTTPSGVANVKVNGVTATLTGESWTLADVALSIGSNTITITATDIAGNTANTTIIVIRNQPNTQPSVNAGQDQTISLPNIANLIGTATDDGLPNGSQLSVNWTKVSGSGTVLFGNPNSTLTTAVFSQSGTYIIRLTATDGLLTTYDELNVEVTSPPSNLAPIVSAGADKSVGLPNNNFQFIQANENRFNELASNPPTVVNFDDTAAETNINGNSFDGILFETGDQPSPSAPLIVVKASETYTSSGYVGILDAATNKLMPTTGENVLSPGGKELAQGNPLKENDDIRLTFAEPVAAVGFDILFQSYDFYSAVAIKIYDPQGNILYQNSNLPVLSQIGGGAPGGKEFFGFISKRSNIKTIVIDEYDGDNVYPDANIGLDSIRVQKILPRSTFVNLDGTVSDDGLPVNNTLTSSWSQVSGSGTATFANTNSPSTAVTFATAGTYILRLSASDGELTASDDVTVVATDSNISVNDPPIVNLGTDRFVTFPTNYVGIVASVSDDGLPAGSGLTYQWGQVSGPTTVTFGSANSYQTNVFFSSTGVYVVRLTAYDGEYSSSDDVTITVDSVNQAPTVEAGVNQLISLSDSAILSGTATDDGLPVGSSLQVIWSKTSGNGNVAFSNPTFAATTSTFTQAGIYVLRLTATDGTLTVFDELTITVNSQNGTPQVQAGNDQLAMFKANLADNPSAEAELINGQLPNWTANSGLLWTRVLGEQANVPAARFGDYVFKAHDATNSEIRQTIDLSGFAGVIDAGTQQFTWQAYIHSSAETNPDTGKVIVEYLNSTQNVVATLTSDDIISTDNWHLTEDTRVPPVGTRFMRLRLIAVRNNGTTNDVFFDGLSLKAVGDVAAVRLSGTATDDGLPVGNPFTKIWTKVSGNGNVLFAANEAISGSTYDAPGTYTLRLTASDGVLSATDDVTVTINPANQAPTTNAGIDQTITLPSTVQLNGTASDDVGNLRYRWTKVYGSGGGTGLGVVTFSNARLLNPTASFTLPGTYVLRLTTEDGELETTDDVTVTVNPGATNLPPTVSPGSNQTIVLPINSVQLNGTVTDDGLPTNNLTTNWTKTSGSGNVIFSNPTSPITTATFDTAGVYVLRLTAADGQFTVWHEVLVAVIPVGGQGGTNQPPTVNVGADQNITVSQTGILEAQVSDDGLPAGGNFTANWTKVSGLGNVTFSNPNNTGTYANFSQTGVYVVRLTVSDSLLTAFDDVTVTVSDNQPAPTVDILTPLDGANLTDKTVITGNVSGGNWKVESALKTGDNSNNLSWTLLNQGSGAVSNSSLAVFDTTLLLNGLYEIRLTTSDQFGQNAIDEISLVVERNLKVGQFTVSFEDMSVPVAGIPIQVIRTYDSRDKRKGDFGYGWTLGIKNLRVEKSQVLGLKWRETTNGGLFPTYCIENTKPHIVSVTMPDGKVEKFDARLQKMCQQYVPLQGGNLIFAAQPGTTGKLEVVGDNTIQVAGSIPGPVDFIGFNGQGIFDSAQFKYTSKDGTEFILNQNGGLQSVRDLNNNTLTISANGITHSSGKSVSFTRDNQGRISAITDPDGKIQTYNYDANGDLISFVNRASETTSYSYYTNPAHHLKDITDARGITPIRNEYDVAGRLIKHTDANGNEIIYTHDLAAKTEIVRDRLGNATTFAYDVRGNVLQKTDALGHVSSFTYDLFDNVLTETNALGRTSTYTYDGIDNRTSVTDALGNRSEFTYNNLSSLVTAKDAKNNVTTNVYGFRNSLSSTTDALGNVTSNVYLATTGQRATTTDALGNTTAFAYFGNFLTKQTDAQGNETTFDYSPNGNPTSQTVKRTNALGQLETITTTSEFDNLNRLTKTTYADGTFTRTEYNTIGQQAATVDQAGNRTEFEYDSLGRQIKTTYADGKFEESTFDAEGRRLTSKDRSGKVTNYGYDVLGRLKKTTYSDGTFTTTNYDEIGQVLNSTDAKGNTTTYQYDELGRRKKVINALNQTTEFTYDENGNQLAMKDALNHSTSYVYDALNRRTRTNFADSSFTETTFDELGRRIAEKDQAGKITQFVYDSLGRMTKVKDALNHETRFTYNEIGQQIKQIDALNRETKYEYDKLGRRTKRILPLGQSETYSYSNQGNLEGKTDFNGKTTTFGYDNMRRLMSKTPDASLNEPSISFTYNDLGQRNSMTDTSGTTNYVYDVRNRLASKQTPQGNLNYTYDENGSIKTLRSNHANGISVDYNYDELSRLSEVKDNRLSGSQNTTYTYDAVGNLQSYTYPNTVTTSYAYNNLNRLTALTVSNGQTNLASYVYTLGASGNRTQVVENTGRTVNYAYDDLYRLTSETIANSANNGQISYQFDAVGNRLQRNSSVNLVPSQSSTFDSNDRLNSDTFDNNGSTKISNGKAYNYDFENHLTSTNDGITVVYDGDGNRVSKTVNGITTKYLVDTNNLTGYAQVVEEIQNGSVTKQYTYGLDLISQQQAGGLSFYNYDGHGSVRGLSNSSGNVTDTYTYDAFGTTIERTGTTDNNYLYAGEQFDSDLGFYYNRARYLNVGTGRFISQDSYEGNSSEPLSIHKYLYANGNPSNEIDPSGNFSISETAVTFGTLSILGAISGVAVNGINNYATGKNFFDGAVGAAAFGAAALPLAYAFPVLGLALAGAGIYSATSTAWQVFSNPNSSGGQKVASAFLVGLSVFGFRGSVKNVQSNGLWVNANFFGSVFGNSRASTMSQSLESVVNRTAEFGDILDGQPNLRGRITMAVGEAVDSSGQRRTLIGTSEPRGYIRAPFRSLIGQDDIVVKGTGHAEADIVSFANQQGWTILGIGATRPICVPCAAEISGAGATAVTPLK
jgi:RHS repeat-associated protein